MQIDTAAVLGAGVMGSAIAAHLAGAGVKTYLLDIVPKDAGARRNLLAERGIQGALKAKPAAFYDVDAARLIVPGNLEDDLERLGDCDLVIEAVVERIDIKRSLFSRLVPHLGKEAILASNTSGLSIDAMGEQLPDDVRERFLGVHFFNPVRYMHLCELIPGAKTRADVVATVAAFGERLGKGIVYAKDTPNFVANRIGVYSMMQSFRTMEQFELTIEAVDKVAGPAMGRPKSAAFRTADVVGIDTLVHVARTCYENLPNDPERDVFLVPDWVQELVNAGRTGQKVKAGFYKKVGKNIQVFDQNTGAYRDQEKVRYDSLGALKGIDSVEERIKTLILGDDAAARFAWTNLASTLCYAARCMGEIADDVVNVDRAMRWGFNWDLGPFEVWDAIGVAESVARMREGGFDVPSWVVGMLDAGRTSFYGGEVEARDFYDMKTGSACPMAVDSKSISLEVVKAEKSRVVVSNMGASLVDLGDGCLGLEVHTKMNTIDNDVIEMMHRGVAEAEMNFEALVVGNDGEHFGAGANLLMVFMGAQQGQWDEVEKMVASFQNGCQAMRYCRVPVVSAPFSLTLGGGAELAMAADASQAFAETYIGLVEVGVGLVPAGGGCLRAVERWTAGLEQLPSVDVLPFVGQGAFNIAKAEVSTGAEQARRLRYIRSTDGVSLSRHRLLYDAKERALGMARAGYRPPRPPVFKAAGVDAASTLAMSVWGMVEGGYASEHDKLIATKVAHILCGGDVLNGQEVDSQHFLDLEREAFLSLCGTEKSQARMQSILMTNKPLRN